MRLYLIIGFFFASLSAGLAQVGYDFHPLTRKPENSGEWKDRFRESYADELKSMPSHVRPLVKAEYQKHLDRIISAIDKRGFIWSDTLQLFLNEVADQLMAHNNFRGRRPILVVLNSPEANAICLGDGTIGVTLGFLSRITHENQLAFVLAHEMAHHQKSHLMWRIHQEKQQANEVTLKQALQELLSLPEPTEELEDLRDSYYDAARLSQKKELEADSLAVIYMHRASLNLSAGDEALRLLNLSYCRDSTSSVEIFAPLNTDKYPIQPEWLKGTLKIQDQEGGTLFFNSDSLRTHPALTERTAAFYSFTRHLPNQNASPRFSDPQKISLIASMAAFESVRAAYDLRMLDVCLYLALDLLQTHPRNGFLISYVANVLSLAIELKKNPGTRIFFFNKTTGYCDALRKVNSFLRSTSSLELADVLFYFLNRPAYFNPDDERHYYHLWKACDTTGRLKVKESIRNRYLERFPKGEYRSKMKR
jgi:Zn-dependent protease with chaperone function